MIAAWFELDIEEQLYLILCMAGCVLHILLKGCKFGDIMDWKTKVTKSLRSTTSDKEAMNRQILKWNKGLKEVEKTINRGKK